MTDQTPPPDGPGPGSGLGPERAADCLFCGVVAGEVPAAVVREGERVLAFRDINPQAPTHVLVVPRRHHQDVAALAAADPDALAELVGLAGAVAEAEGHQAYRLVFNTGAAAGQSVFHVHGHVLAGRPLGWPPG
jgi:histidine triad (HIT) family protein